MPPRPCERTAAIWGVPLHLPPLPAGVQRGAAPLAGGLEGVPPDLYSSSPFLEGRGQGDGVHTI